MRNKRRRKLSAVAQQISKEPAGTIIVSNVVATAFFGVQIDLKEVAWQCHGDFNPDSFAAVSVRLQQPKTTALIFGSGRIVCTGSSSEESAVEAIHQYYRMIKAVAPTAMCVNIRIQNIVSTASLHRSVDIEEMYKRFQISSTYDPELFPGIRIVIEPTHENATLRALLFSSGNCVITGAKNRNEIASGWTQIQEVAKPFLLDRLTSDEVEPSFDPEKIDLVQYGLAE